MKIKMEKILIINSAAEKNKPFLSLFASLSGHYSLFAWSNDAYFLEKFKGQGAERKYFGPRAGGSFGWLFFLFLPFLSAYHAAGLSRQRFFKKIKRIICLEDNEKIIFTLPARLLGMKVIWLEKPEKICRRPARFFLKIFSPLAELAVFTSASKEALIEAGFRKEKIQNISLGFEADNYERQGNIFSPLALADKPYRFFKNFVIGAVVDMGERGQFESLLKAVKNCVNIIPNIQIVVVGSLKERHNLNWLIKKMNLERRVWFVGEQEDIAKWFENFDLYANISSNPNLFDLEMILLSLSSGVPVISFFHPNLADLLIEGETGFFSPAGNIEALTQKIVALEPDKKLLAEAGRKGKELVLSGFSRKKQLEMLAKIVL